MHLYPIPERKFGTTDGAFARIAIGTDPDLAIYDSGPSRDRKLCSREDVYCFAEHDDMNIFAEQVIAMRQWMKDHGQQKKPLIISEYSILWPYVDDGESCYLRDEFGNCFPPSRVNTFMNNSFSYLENAKDPNLGYSLDDNRLIQQWLWFSTYVDQDSGLGGGASNLLNKGQGSMSPIGANFRDKVDTKQLSTNLFPINPFSGEVSTGNNSTVDVTLSVEVMNNGNSVTAQDILVTFYSDSALRNEIGSAVIQKPGDFNAGMVGCATKRIRVEVEWENLPPGLHDYWASVDSKGIVPESNEGDNTVKGYVDVDP